MRAIRSLAHEDALVALEAVSAALKAADKAAVIAIADQQGELIALMRLDGAPYPSIVIAANKAWTAARERKPSMEVGHASRDKDSGFDIGSFGDPRYTAFGGGLPVFADSAVVDAVAVSGLSTEEDIHFATLGIDALHQARS
jgi:glc operon protein GlcG